MGKGEVFCPQPLPKGSTVVKVEGMEGVCAGQLQQERKTAHTGLGRAGAASCCHPATSGQMAAWKQMWVGAGPRALLLWEVFPCPLWHLAPNYLGHVPLAKPPKRCAALSK